MPPPPRQNPERSARRLSWLRGFLPLCALLLLLWAPTEEHRQTPHSHASPAGLCSGDCITCGCPPAMIASGDCCCTLSRRLASMAEDSPTVVTQVSGAT